MAIQRLNTNPPDALLTLRVDDGTTHSTDTTTWLDVGAGYPSGALGGAKIVPAKAATLVLDFAATTNAGAGDTITVTVMYTNTEDGSNPGQGDTGALAKTVTLRTFAGSASADDYVGRHMWQVTNITEPDGAGSETSYRFVGFRVDFASSASAQWGGYVADGNEVGVC